MKLIQLSSNRESFHAINFKDGLNLILGKQSNPNDKNSRNTYNGVGKSLIIYLVHFCLGSNKIKSFEEKIPDWTFYLRIQIDEEVFLIERNTSEQSYIFVNDVKKGLKDFRSMLFEKIFKAESKIKYITFNTLFSRFIRRDRECYTSYDKFIAKEQEYARLLNNAFLLGLDIDNIDEKKRLRAFQISTESLKKSLEKDPVLKEHFSHKNDTEIEILDLEVEIRRLESELNQFKLANNYDQLEKEADELTYKIKKTANDRTLITNAIKNIEQSMKIEPDISQKRIIEIYEAANIEIPSLVVKKLDEVLDFHESLLNNRKSRLIKELKKNRQLLKEVEGNIQDDGQRLDQLFQYLDTHGALDEHTKLTNRLSELKMKLDKLLEYQKIMKTYKRKLLEIKKDYNEKNLEVSEYLEQNSDLIDRIKATFRDLTRQFYDKGAGIKVENNDGENTLRYNIDVTIQDDSSDGVNEVKIFCFDIMILLLQINHNMKFLFHDSRLFGNMDPRQRGTVFKMAEMITRNKGLQYIATVNQDQIESFRDLYEDDEFEIIINENIILTLTDESDESKLLGVQVDMKYEKG